jgi:hypothetical protein
MADKGWKQAERAMARDVGCERIPVTGEREGADFGKGTPFAYQLKVRGMLPSWMFSWLDGICGTAKRHNQVGVLVLNRPRNRRSEALVVLRWADWCDLHGCPDVDGGSDALPEAVEPSK